MKIKTKIKKQLKRYIDKNLGKIIIIGTITIIGIAANINLMLIKIPVDTTPIKIIQKEITPEKCLEITYNTELKKYGEMGNAIKLAAEEFATGTESIKLKGLLLGIANAESSLGKSFAIEYDKNCHNWWGVKGGNMQNRKDGSYLRCFNDETAGARTVAKLLKNNYINQGLDTPEKIVNKYVGNKWSVYHQTWINNVNKYFKNI